MMKSLPVRQSALVLCIVSTIPASPYILGQDEQVNEIQITGTRIRQTDGMSAPTPVTSLTTMELMSFEPGGTIAEQLDALPQFFATGTAQRGGPSFWSDGGGSYLDMRGLGRNRTLVLLDGSRLPPADKRGTVNVDNIPTALVQSVDVVTGGASAAYGADALGGVTNFVLNREFEGFKVNVGTGMNEYDNDGKNWNISVAGGRRFGERLNIIGSAQTRKIDEIYRDPSKLDSDWFQRWGYMPNPDPDGPARITVPWAATTSLSPSGVISGTGTSLDGMVFNDEGTDIMPYQGGSLTNGGITSGGLEAQKYHRAAASPISGAEVNNWQGFLAAQYAITDSLGVFVQALVGRTESYDKAEVSNFSMSFPWYSTIYRENPYLPESVAEIMDANDLDSFQMNKMGNYLGELEPGTLEHSKSAFTTESWSIGFDLVLPNGWDLRGSWQSGESRKRDGEYPSIRVDLEALSRDAVRHPETGEIVCNIQLYNPTPEQLANSAAVQGRVSSRTGEPLSSPIGLDNAVSRCVPYNAMGAGNLSREAAEYMHTVRISDSIVEQDFAELLLRGEAHRGWGYGPVSFATGLTYREQSFSDMALPYDVDVLGPPINDPSLGIRGIATAYTGGTANLHHFASVNNISGSYDVWEWFGELNIPLWESASGAQSLGGNLAYRSSDYSSSGRVESWKVGFDLQLFEGLRFRATKSQDVREASFAERFDIATSGALVEDPFTDSLNVNITTMSGGNPNLRPEYADTNVVGFVFEPSWLAGLQISTDWYQVNISDSVDTLTVQQIVDQCYETGELCQNLERDANGTLVRVLAPYLNLAEARVEGVDLEAVYRFEPNFFADELETFTFRGLVGHLIERVDVPPQGTPINLVGSSVRPENTGNVTANYTVGPWGLQWQQRFIDETKKNINWVEGIDVDDNSTSFYSFTNLRFTYSGETNAGANWQVGLSVNNAFDKNPPVLPSTPSNLGVQSGGLNSFDKFGRRYQLTFNLEL